MHDFMTKILEKTVIKDPSTYGHTTILLKSQPKKREKSLEVSKKVVKNKEKE